MNVHKLSLLYFFSILPQSQPSIYFDLEFYSLLLTQFVEKPIESNTQYHTKMVIEILHVANSKWTKINLNLVCINISIKNLLSNQY